MTNRQHASQIKFGDIAVGDGRPREQILKLLLDFLLSLNNLLLDVILLVRFIGFRFDCILLNCMTFTLCYFLRFGILRLCNFLLLYQISLINLHHQFLFLAWGDYLEHGVITPVLIKLRRTLLFLLLEGILCFALRLDAVLHLNALEECYLLVYLSVSFALAENLFSLLVLEDLELLGSFLPLFDLPDSVDLLFAPF